MVHVPDRTAHVVVASVGIPVGMVIYNMVRVGLKLEPNVNGVDKVKVICE